MDMAQRKKLYNKLKDSKDINMNTIKYILYQKTANDLNSGSYEFIIDDIKRGEPTMYDADFISEKISKIEYINFILAVSEF